MRFEKIPEPPYKSEGNDGRRQGHSARSRVVGIPPVPDRHHVGRPAEKDEGRSMEKQGAQALHVGQTVLPRVHHNANGDQEVSQSCSNIPENVERNGHGVICDTVRMRKEVSAYFVRGFHLQDFGISFLSAVTELRVLC